MSKTTIGVILLVVGVIGLVAVYSMRPPSSFGDAIMILGQGRKFFIKEPLYQIFMSIFGLLSVFGIIKIVRAMNSDKNPNS